MTAEPSFNVAAFGVRALDAFSVALLVLEIRAKGVRAVAQRAASVGMPIDYMLRAVRLSRTLAP